MCPCGLDYRVVRKRQLSLEKGVSALSIISGDIDFAEEENLHFCPKVTSARDKQ